MLNFFFHPCIDFKKLPIRLGWIILLYSALTACSKLPMIDTQSMLNSASSDRTPSNQLLPDQMEAHHHLSVFMSIVTATFVSEDLTVITAGLLIRKNAIPLVTSAMACFCGIFLGDLGLFLLGFMLKKVPVSHRFFKKWQPVDKSEPFVQMKNRIQKEGWKLLFLSRFVPGTRFVVYTTAGYVGGSSTRMILVALLAGLIWTPLLLLATILFGEHFLHLFEWLTGPGLWSVFLAIVCLYLAHRLIFSLLLKKGRANWSLRLARLKYMEFWPIWLFYLPVPFFLIALAIRYRGLTTLTAANPGLPSGGFIGESKELILSFIPKKYVPKYIVFDPNLHNTKDILPRCKRLGLPLIVKPDVSQKGIGLRKINNLSQLSKLMESLKNKTIIQKFHPGPYEAGVFYYRLPGSQTGSILSITRKEFPQLIADGVHSTAELIHQHHRYRLQADVFLQRLGEQGYRIEKKGTSIALGIAGNHFQGTRFLQASDWITADLIKKIDQISRAVSKKSGGFFFGRYDIRYSNQQKFQTGKDIAIIELNGVTSESTDMYDSNLSLGQVYKIMWTQLSLAYKIGAANVQSGFGKSSLFKLCTEILGYLKNRPRELVSD